MLLQELNEHENIIRLLNVVKAKNDKDIYLIFEYTESNLYAVIRANILEPIHKKFIMYQMLKALKFIHSAGIIHRDLKPSNILINSDATIKICDFGLAMCLKSSLNKDATMTDNDVLRWYRAPEILLGSTNYTTQSDMWSVGCIFAELLGGKTLFPGTSILSQINKVLEVTGKPTKDDIMSIRSDLAETMLETIIVPETKSLKSLFHKCNSIELDFLSKLLVFNPNERITLDEALEHPYVSEFHEVFKDTETVCDRHIQIPNDDNINFTVDEYTKKLYDEILERMKEIRKNFIAKQKNLSKGVPHF
jgi:mitogen-activated protein kinase 15